MQKGSQDMPYQSLARPMDIPDFQAHSQARPLCSIMKLKNKLQLLDYNSNGNGNGNGNGSESMERKVHYVIRKEGTIHRPIQWEGKWKKVARRAGRRAGGQASVANQVVDECRVPCRDSNYSYAKC